MRTVTEPKIGEIKLCKNCLKVIEYMEPWAYYDSREWHHQVKGGGYHGPFCDGKGGRTGNIATAEPAKNFLEVWKICWRNAGKK